MGSEEGNRGEARGRRRERNTGMKSDCRRGREEKGREWKEKKSGYRGMI